MQHQLEIMLNCCSKLLNQLGASFVADAAELSRFCSAVAMARRNASSGGGTSECQPSRYVINGFNRS